MWNRWNRGAERSAGSESAAVACHVSDDVHRGPDDEGIHIEGGVGFGMRRLSIIDLSGGKQLIFNEDRTITRNSAVIIISPSGAEIAAFCVNASAVSRIVRSKLNNCWRCYLR